MQEDTYMEINKLMTTAMHVAKLHNVAKFNTMRLLIHDISTTSVAIPISIPISFTIRSPFTDPASDNHHFPIKKDY